MRTWPHNVVAFGGDYNPEQWSRQTWTQDVELMARAGVTFVSLGVFSWSFLQPAPGAFEFAWLDEVMDLLGEAGIAVDLATATASPPPWLSQAHPETLPMTREGVRLHPGSRQAWCPSSPVFTGYAVALTEQLARRYHEHPALAMWHVSNEYGCHHLPCYCATCDAGFRAWLQRRYGDLETLNEAWGTAFWSQRRTAWEQVETPKATPAQPNPTQALDFWRYGSDALLAQYIAERDVLRRHSPGVPVTTNFMTMDHFRLLDYVRWAPEVDVVSTDHYVVHQPRDASADPRADPVAEQSFAGDLTRGLAGGAPWVLMEHSSSATNWQPVNRAKPAGAMLRDSLTHVAHGADTVGFFQWRASRAGAEKFHSALLPHAGPDTARFAEACELGAVCGRLGELTGSRVRAQVALVWDYVSARACAQDAHPSSAVDAGQVAHDLHAALRAAGITVDVLPPGADLGRYAVVLVPTLYLCTQETADSVAAAAHAGAQVLITYFSGIVDEAVHVGLGGYPAVFRNLLGVRVEEFFPLLPGEQVALDDGTTGTLWSEHLREGDAAVLARYATGPLAGSPALTRRVVGAGAAWYVSTRLDRDGVAALLDQVCRAAGVGAPVPSAPGLEVLQRVSDEESPAALWTFLINHGDSAVPITLSGHDLVRDRPVQGTWDLPAGAVAVVREA